MWSARSIILSKGPLSEKGLHLKCLFHFNMNSKFLTTAFAVCSALPVCSTCFPSQVNICIGVIFAQIWITYVTVTCETYGQQ